MFLDRKIGYVDIGRIMERVLEEHDVSYEAGLEELVEVDQWARIKASDIAMSLAR